MNRRPSSPWLYRSAGLALSFVLAPLALAEVPPAMDRVPSDVPVVFVMKNVGQAYQNVSKLADTLHVPAGARAGLQHASDMLKTAGLNSDGSAAVAIMSLEGGEDEEDGPLVMVVPVSDYAAFVKALGATGSGVESVKIQNDTAFVKDLGGGFAAMSPKKELVDQFAGKAGSGAAFEELMGSTGKAVAEDSNVFLVANMAKVGPAMQANVDDKLDMAAAMGQNEAQLAATKAMIDNFFRDAQAGIVGLKLGEEGSHLDFAAQFKEGTEAAKNFSSKGEAGKLLGALPKLEEGYLFAFAMDTSAPGIKAAFKSMLNAAAKDPEAAKMMSGLNPIEQIEKMDGMGFLWGTTPVLMGGVLLNAVTYIKTPDPAAYVEATRKAMTTMNDKAVEGITYKTSYQPGGAKAGETPVDVWSMKFQVDPNNPAAQQIAMMQGMIFGPGGLNGYLAQAPGGVVLTYSKNSDLVSKTLASATSGEGLSTDAGVKSVQANLPAGRTAEAYIGIKDVLKTAQNVMSMMGGGGGDFTPPEDLPPIGIGGTTNGGGLRASIYVPTKVMTTIKAFGDSMSHHEGGDMEQGEEPAEKPENKKTDKTGQPKF